MNDLNMRIAWVWQLLSILPELTQGPRVRAVVKVLVASPSSTLIVRRHEAFDGGRNTISLAVLPELGLGPSKWRVGRQLGEGLGAG
jgi:hypothetical protein